MSDPATNRDLGDERCPCPDPWPVMWRPRDAWPCRHPVKWRGIHGEMRCRVCGRCLDHGALAIPPRSMATVGGVTVANHTDWPIDVRGGLYATGTGSDYVERVPWIGEVAR